MEPIYSKYFLQYEGPAVEQEMEAGKLGNALIGLKDGITKICKTEKDLEKVEINVRANRKGSFIVDLVVGVAIATAGTLIANKLNGKLKNFTNQFRIKKFARGDKVRVTPKFGNKIELTNKNNEIISVSPEDYEIHNSKIIDKDISKVVEALEEEKITKLHTGIPGTEYIESINIKDKAYFITQEAGELPELVDQKDVTIEGEIISFSKRHKRIGFAYKGRLINCHPATSRNLLDFIEFAKSSNVKLYGKIYRPDKTKLPVIYIKKIDYIQPPLV